MRLIFTSVEKRVNSDRKGHNKKTRVYVYFSNETVSENFVERRWRPIDEMSELMPQILESVGLDPEMKFRWSQKAGCSCGCSPGFILGDHFGSEIFVVFQWEPETKEEQEKFLSYLSMKAKEAGREVVQVGSLIAEFDSSSSQPAEVEGLRIEAA